MKEIINTLTRSQLDLIWDALHFYREHGINESAEDSDEENPPSEQAIENDAEWDEICGAMAIITDQLWV